MGIKMYKSDSLLCDEDRDEKKEKEENISSNPENSVTANFVEQQNNALGIGGTFEPNKSQTIDQKQILSKEDIEEILKNI